jgi:hypothetical protein
MKQVLETGRTRKAGRRRDGNVLTEQPVHPVMVAAHPDDLQGAVLALQEVIIADKEHHPGGINLSHPRDIPGHRRSSGLHDKLLKPSVHIPQALSHPVAATCNRHSGRADSKFYGTPARGRHAHQYSSDTFEDKKKGENKGNDFVKSSTSVY